MELDVRDLGGRLRRLVLAIALGVVGSVAIALVLPTRDHFPDPPGSCGNGHWSQGWLVEGGDPVLILVGVVVIASAAYALLGRVRRRARLPRAIALRC